MFNDVQKVTKPYILAADAPGTVQVSTRPLSLVIANDLSIARQKRDRLVGSKDTDSQRKCENK